jgi:hypothetical protein
MLTGCASTSSEDVWVSQDNFLEPPAYQELIELESKPSDAVCNNKECNKAVSSSDTLYRAILLNEDNYSEYLIGVWSGGDCLNDRWLADNNDQFDSQYPLDDGMYAWSGNYFFNGSVYVEDGINADGGKEWNEAYLYFLPETGLLIYKGIKNFESYNQDGSINYTYYDGSDFFYFKRCQ